MFLKVTCDFLKATSWMAFETYNTMFSQNFPMLNSIMQSDQVNCECIDIKTQENSIIHIVYLLLCFFWKKCL